jgi:enamine deaminase RidA (YjgF/YER057c/UK114 family)
VDGLPEPGALIKIWTIATRQDKEAINPGSKEFTAYQQLTYAPAIKTGGIIWLSGITGFELGPENRKTYSGDTESQSNRTYELVDQILKTAGASLADLIFGVQYVAPQAILNYDIIAKARQAATGQSGSFAVADIVVNRLLSPNRHLELELVAAASSESKRSFSVKQLPDRRGSVLAAEAGGLVFLSGVLPVDPSTGSV